MALSKSGHQVSIITCRTDSTKFIKKVFPNAVIYQLDAFLALHGRYPIPKNFHELQYLWKNVFLSETKIILNTRFFFTTTLFATISKLKKLNFIILEHGSNYIGFGTPLDILIHTYEHCVTFYLKLLGAKFYGISTAANKWLQKFDIKAKGKINNCAQISIKKSSPSITQTKNQKTWLYIGRLLPSKGIIELYEAFCSLYGNSNAHRLIIAGSGELADEIRQRSKWQKNVTFLGPISHIKVAQLLASSNGLFLPTRYPEGMPTIILEAFAHNCFVIASKAGGLNEIISHGKTGYLLNSTNISAIKKAFQWLEENQHLMHQCTQNAHNYLLLEHSPSKVVYQVEQAFI